MFVFFFLFCNNSKKINSVFKVFLRPTETLSFYATTLAVTNDAKKIVLVNINIALVLRIWELNFQKTHES